MIARFALGGIVLLLAALGSSVGTAADQVFVDFAGIDRIPGLTDAQKGQLKDKIKQDLQRNFNDAVGAGKIVITVDPAEKDRAARRITFVDSEGNYVDSNGVRKQAYGIWPDGGKDTFVAVRQFTVKHAADYRAGGNLDLDKLANGMGLVAAHEVGHSYSLGHNKKKDGQSKMTEGGLIKSSDIATKTWTFDAHTKKHVTKQLGKQPSKTARDYFDACCSVLRTSFHESPDHVHDLFEYGYFDADFSFAGTLASQFDVGWLGEDTDAGLSDGNAHFDFIYKTSMEGTDEDADMLSFFADAHFLVQFVLQGQEGTPYAGRWILMDQGVLQPSDFGVDSQGMSFFRAFSLDWNVDGQPGVDVGIMLNARDVYGDLGTDVNGWRLVLVREPPSAALLGVGIFTLLAVRRRRY